MDSNQRPPGYEPDELPLLYSAIRVQRYNFFLNLQVIRAFFIKNTRSGGLSEAGESELAAEGKVACIAETRHDIGLVVERFVHGGHP